LVWDNSSKDEIKPDNEETPKAMPKDEPISHQVVGRVKAYQADDG
jgi:hypothetical protein